MLMVKREVLVDQLFLQGHGGGRDHQFFLGQTGHRDSTLGIGKRFADTGTRLGHQNTALLVILSGQGLGDFRHQEILLLAGHETG